MTPQRIPAPQPQPWHPASGSYPARLSQWIDLGTHDNPFAEGKTRRLVRLTFTVFHGNQSALVSKDFTCSLGAKASLRKFLESWRGEPMTAEAISDFTPLKTLEKPALISISLSAPNDQGRRFPNITGIMRLPHGMPPPPDLRSPARHFSLETPARLVFQTLPQFLQTKIRSSREWASLKRQSTHA